MRRNQTTLTRPGGGGHPATAPARAGAPGRRPAGALVPRAGALAVALVLAMALVGCGDDGGDGDAGGGLDVGDLADKGADGGDPGDVADGTAGGGTGSMGDLDLCALLDVSQIESALGTSGLVAEGREEQGGCTWDVEAGPGAPDSGVVALGARDLAPPFDEAFAETREVSGDVVDVQGVGEEAFYVNGAVTFRSDGLVIWVQEVFFPERPGTEQEVTSLAQQVLERV